MNSISRKLLVLLLSAITVAALIAGISSYLKAHDEISELFDYQLVQIALSHRNQKNFKQLPPTVSEYEKDEGLTVQIWDGSGKLIYVSANKTPLPRVSRTGLQTVTMQDTTWQVFLLASQGRMIQVAQSFEARREISFEFALRTIVPLFIIFSALALIIWLIVRYTLKPLTEVANGVSRLSPASLEALPVDALPVEILPLVQRLNYLFDQLGHAFDIQKRFVADAAHELRTPLTAVKLQVHLLEHSNNEEERGEALASLKTGVERAIRMVGQLLALARVEPVAPQLPMTEVALNVLIRDIVAEQSRIAIDRGINLGIGDNQPVSVTGEPDALRAMISNLVDNAIRYTAPGGTIDVNVRKNGLSAIIEVADSGPGIPPEDRERVFDRFYRGQRTDGKGCGLGLAIVKSAVTRHSGSITLTETAAGIGLTVVIELPCHQLG